MGFAPAADTWRNFDCEGLEGATRNNPEVNATRIVDSTSEESVFLPRDNTLHPRGPCIIESLVLSSCLHHQRVIHSKFTMVFKTNQAKKEITGLVAQGLTYFLTFPHPRPRPRPHPPRLPLFSSSL